eukprot:gnl/MRDRNA2_/MRDRNA2_61608_c0_seq2.p1 gnl/MRDRNA2_/MRDRNA2_61608_c0~~gnl/MRDRNA2_/MRDRNA2_61608_c0_seq2.p1  ORF type:complete len:217 (-),score=25.43 gnl/MRDRNA2_/MRDRNA2_61608_c0_seq2:65-628(-)
MTAMVLAAAGGAYGAGPKNVISSASPVAAAQGAVLNVYGESLANCGTSPGSGEGDFCSYRSFDAGAHQVCVTKLPPSFSDRTGQSSWSDAYTGQSWCICIWAYANYYLNYGDGDLPIKCDALPSEVLVSQYSLDKWRNYGKMSTRPGGDKFRKAIDRMCNTCASQARSESAKKEIQMKCEAIQLQEE